MRPMPRISVRQLAINISCIGLLFVFCNSVWTQETKKTNPRIKELQQQRLTILEEIRDAAKTLFANARTSYENLYAAERELLTARIAYAETQNDRIKACDEAVQHAIEYHLIVQEKVRASRATRIEELKAQTFVLEAQIMRENAIVGD